MSPMELARLSLLVVHFLGLAALIGPFLAQVGGAQPPRVRLMLVGALVQVVTGNALIAANRLQGLEVDEMKMIVKLAMAVGALGVLVLAGVKRRRTGPGVASVRPLFLIAGGLGVANVVVAVVWT